MDDEIIWKVDIKTVKFHASWILQIINLKQMPVILELVKDSTDFVLMITAR